MPNTNLFQHIVIDNKAPRTIFLLHGTGGTEHDFLFLNDNLNNKYNLVGLRGNVSENGMNRFFKRVSFGVFDQESIRGESAKLSQFIQEWVDRQQVSIDSCVFLGYSNGANMLLASLFNYPDLFKNLVLLHPMLPFEPHDQSLDLKSHNAFVSYGTFDQMISDQESKKVIKFLTSVNMNLTVKEYESGHEITEEEIHDVIQYLR